jgi:sarcosine oxidase
MLLQDTVLFTGTVEENIAYGSEAEHERIVAAVREWVERRLPRLDPTPIRAETCIYTNVEDERFVCERRGRYVLGSACSGHGFKFAPAVGELLASLAST